MRGKVKVKFFSHYLFFYPPRPLIKIFLNNNNMPQDKEKLSIRRRASLWICMLMMKIIQPTEYSHEYSKELERVKNLIKEL